MTSLFEHSGLPSILLFEAVNGAVFGAFFDHHLEYFTEKFIGTHENFVFKLRPSQKKFQTEEEVNSYYFYCSKNNLYIGGGGHGCALAFGDDLKSGISMKSQTFANEPLHYEVDDKGRNWDMDGINDFDIKNLEVIVLS